MAEKNSKRITKEKNQTQRSMIFDRKPFEETYCEPLNPETTFVPGTQFLNFVEKQAKPSKQEPRQNIQVKISSAKIDEFTICWKNYLALLQKVNSNDTDLSDPNAENGLIKLIDQQIFANQKLFNVINSVDKSAFNIFAKIMALDNELIPPIEAKVPLLKKEDSQKKKELSLFQEQSKKDEFEPICLIHSELKNEEINDVQSLEHNFKKSNHNKNFSPTGRRFLLNEFGTVFSENNENRLKDRKNKANHISHGKVYRNARRSPTKAMIAENVSGQMEENVRQNESTSKRYMTP